MKKIILLATAIMMAGSLTGCFSLSAEDTLKYNPDPKARSEASAIIESSKEEESASLSGDDAYGFFKWVSEDSNVSYDIGDKAATFLKEHGILFKDGINNLTNDLVDRSIAGNMISKNPARYGDSIIYIPKLSISQISELQKGESGDDYYTLIMACNWNDGSIYTIVYNGVLDTIAKNDSVYVYGLPLGMAQMGTVFGGDSSIEMPVLAGSIIGKDGENPALTNNTAAEPTIAQDAEVVEDMAKNEQLSDDPYYPGGVWNMTYDGGGNTINIAYDPNNDVFLASFSGSYDDYAGGTDGYLVAYTDGSDGLWQYYTDDSYTPIFKMKVEGNVLTVSPDEGYQTFGGMDFPGFDGTYTRDNNS